MTENQSRCFYFGCWNEPGHYLFGPDGRRPSLPPQEAYLLSCTLDSAFAPKRHRDGSITFGEQPGAWSSRPDECHQGQFLRHQFNGYTLLQWWDRCQGDTRGACNSTILLEGEHTTAELLAALDLHFPHIRENLRRHEVELVELERP